MRQFIMGIIKYSLLYSNTYFFVDNFVDNFKIINIKLICFLKKFNSIKNTCFLYEFLA